jgi:hypothetical protein
LEILEAIGRRAGVVRGRTKVQRNDEIVRLACGAVFVGAPHQAFAGVACDWRLINHMLGVAISSPSDSRQDFRSTHISLYK